MSFFKLYIKYHGKKNKYLDFILFLELLYLTENDMDSSEVIDIKQDLDEQESRQEGKETEDSHLVIESQSQTDEGDEIDELGNDGENPVDIHNETIGQHSTRTHSMPTSTQSSPDQLNDLQSYLVTFNKEIGHGGQPTGYTIGEIDASNLASQTRQVLYNVGEDQLLNVATSLHTNQGILFYII